MYPDMAIGGSIVAPGLLTRIWEQLHRWALRRATRVIVLGEDMRARIIAKGVDPGNIADRSQTAPTSVPAAVSAPPPPVDPEVIRAIRGEFRFVLLHAGNLGFYGAWDNTARSRATTCEGDGVGLVFVGEGAQRAQLETRSRGASNIRFLPFFPGEQDLRRSSLLGTFHCHRQARPRRRGGSQQNLRHPRCRPAGAGCYTTGNGRGIARRATVVLAFRRTQTNRKRWLPG